MGFFATFGGTQGVAHVEEWMADIAMVFHWAPDVMDHMPLDELLDWRARAVNRHHDIQRFHAQIAGAKVK